MLNFKNFMFICLKNVELGKTKQNLSEVVILNLRELESGSIGWKSEPVKYMN